MLRSAERARRDRIDCDTHSHTDCSRLALPLFRPWPASTLPLVETRKGLSIFRQRQYSFTLGPTNTHANNRKHSQHLAARAYVWQELRRPGESRTLNCPLGSRRDDGGLSSSAGTMFGLDGNLLWPELAYICNHTRLRLSASALRLCLCRRNAGNLDFHFGTGKVTHLGGFTGD